MESRSRKLIQLATQKKTHCNDDNRARKFIHEREHSFTDIFDDNNTGIPSFKSVEFDDVSPGTSKMATGII